MRLPQHCGHYVRVGLATLFTCIAVWETFQNVFLQLYVLLWWVASLINVLVVVVQGVRVCHALITARRRAGPSRLPMMVTGQLEVCRVL